MKTKARGNGQGTAYKRKNSSYWTASVVVGWRPSANGNPIPIKRTKSGFETKRDALAYCPTLLAGGIRPKKIAPRLVEYWDIYANGEMLNLSSSTKQAYKIAWKKLRPIHDVLVDTITVDLLRQTVSQSCKSYDTAKDCKDLLSNLYKLAAADGYASKDLPSFIVLPKKQEKERIPFTAREQEALWELYESGDKRAAIPLLMIYTGMMPGETQMLTVDHINLEERTITHAGLKTEIRKRTPVVLSTSIIPVVEDLIANARPNGFIWKHNEEEWYRNYYDALEAAGCRRLPPYSCRHTTATALTITEGIAPQTVQRVMRWSSTRMLDRYAHPNVSDALEAVDVLPTNYRHKG